LEAGGKDFMQDLNVIVHRTLVESQEWAERVVRRKASALAKTFLEALKPLFALHAQDQRPRPKMLSGTYMGSEGYLESVFEDALSLHGRSLISTSSFQAIMYTPGTLFDETTMESPSVRPTCLKKRNVKFCVQPALLCYDGAREIVDYQAFVPPGSEPRPHHLVVHKAVVILEDDLLPQPFVEDSEEECSFE
jgi:hypothetical protein